MCVVVTGQSGQVTLVMGNLVVSIGVCGHPSAPCFHFSAAKTQLPLAKNLKQLAYDVQFQARQFEQDTKGIRKKIGRLQRLSLPTLALILTPNPHSLTLDGSMS